MEFLDCVGIVVGHTADAHADSSEFILNVTQFHELTHAEWSPIDTAIENKEQAFGAH